MRPSLLPVGRRVVFVLALPLSGACAAIPPVEEDPDRIPLRGVDFQGDRVAASTPGTIEGSITVTNRRPTAARLTFPDPCVALIRVYDVEPSRRVPVWDQASERDCEGEPVVVELAPGETLSVSTRPASAALILGDSLPAGRYRLTAYVRPDGRVVEVEVGEADLADSR